jgi:uncharacterized membrane protein
MQPQGTIDSKRLEFFSDAVLAVAITLMVLRIDPPVPARGETLVHAFWTDTGPQIIYFLITFAVIVGFWVRHHDIFVRLGDQTDRHVLVANMTFLALICLLPFGLEFFSDDPRSYLTTAGYAGIMALCSLSMIWLRHAALGGWNWRAYLRVGLFLLPIPFAGLLGGWSPLLWALNWPLSMWFDRPGVNNPDDLDEGRARA